MIKELKFRTYWKTFKAMRHFAPGYIQCGAKGWDTGILFPIEETKGGVYLGGSQVMMYSGLKDKTGKDIYEGDIICSYFSDGSECLHEIQWDEKAARFAAMPLPRLDFMSPCGITQDWINEFDKKVVGNIHENPELIKGV
jgi:hypothetical protein